MTAKSRTTRQQGERGRKSAEIKDAALRLFATKGYEGTTIEDIAVELGYAKASLYYYFPGKEAIVKSLIGDSMDEASARMDRLFERSSHPVDNLRDLIGNYIDDADSQRSFFQIHHQVGHFMDSILSPEERVEMGLKMRDMNEKILGLIRRGVEEGYYWKMEPQVLAEMLLGMLGGLMAPATFGKGWDRQAMKQQIIKILINGITKREEI